MKNLRKLFISLFGILTLCGMFLCNTVSVKAASCTPIVSIGAYLGKSGGYDVYYLRYDGKPAFCMNPRIMMDGDNNCKEAYKSAKYVDTSAKKS